MIRTRLKDRSGFVEMLVRLGFNTLGEFADKSGVGYHTIQQVTSGRRQPTPRTAFKIAAAVGKPFDELFEFVHFAE